MPRQSWIVSSAHVVSETQADRLSCEVQDMVAKSSTQRSGEKTQKTIFDALSDISVPAQERTPRRLEDEGLIVVVAGTETTARALTVASYHIFNNKPLLIKLRDEIRTVMLTPTTKASWSELEQLPYLVSKLLRPRNLVMGRVG